MDEIEKLRTEIKILNKRISALESVEHRRNAFKGIRIIVKILVYLAIGYGIWYGYNYITNYIPNLIQDGIKDIVPSVFG